MSLSTLRSIVVTLVTLLVVAPFASAGEKATPPDIPAQVKAFGIGHHAFVHLTDGRHLSGKITSIDATSFTLNRGPKHGSETVAYIDVAKLQQGRLTTGDKVSLGILGAMIGTAIYLGMALYRSGLTGSNG
jgi:hypothetical protein